MNVKDVDWRFKIAHKEAWIGLSLATIHFLWWYGFAYGLGKRPVDEYTYLFGLPAWFFYSCVVGFVVMLILVSAAVKFLFKDIPFDFEEGDSH
ncbi:YhdT family protein [Lederbergia citrea]|uniref:YhdT family protein n=1 Tax=Lederbergia citrea TaxID=2833581 RepID=A0A942USC3_9BACI|nr:YhdT family protein [Lederbergia citrea]MBS4176713.1 YhdT family protein [Lederbergia citrea]MBS4203274.1 YhdT family protein [Lederbergia citrea]MBS4222054.1 YhdT family protein [Lederbergia citrea]